MKSIGMAGMTSSDKISINSSDEPTLDSDAAINKGRGPKGKKRKTKPMDEAAPRQPRTGYVRFLNSRRETVRAENPSLSFSEIMKILAQEWTQLPPDEKRPYLEAGEQDRERYFKELDAYKKTDAYKEFLRQQQEEKVKEQREQAEQRECKEKVREVQRIPNDLNGLDIPIFTEEFLEHNKAREAELRQLRKTSTDLELQNASLNRIVESMRSAVTSLEADTAAQRANNAALSRHLEQLRTTLVAAFKDVPLPGTNEQPTPNTIDSYMSTMHSVLLEDAGGGDNNSELFAKVSGIVDRLDLHG